MGRLFRIVVCVLASLALGLTVSSSALAQGGPSGSSSPSAGDNQYIDPLANTTKPHKAHRRTSAQTTTTHTSSGTPATSSTGGAASPSPAPPASYAGTSTAAAGTPTAGSTGSNASSVAKPHRKHARATPRHSAGKRPTATVPATPTVSAAPAASVSAPPHSGSTFPYVYLIIGACVAVGIGVLGRRLLFRRALHRA